MTAEHLYGIHPVREALKAGRRTFHDVFFPSGRLHTRQRALADRLAVAKIPVRRCAADALDALAGNSRHQGVVARVSPFLPWRFAQLAEALSRGCLVRWLLLLDSIVDPQNLGALIRTAACAGVGAVVIPRDRSARPSPSVSKASAGALEHVPVCMVTNLAATVGELKGLGFWAAALDRRQGRSLFESDLTGDLALLVGAEDKGIRPLVRKQCDFTVAVPQSGVVDSLNAAAAGAVVMYECLRQRSSSK